jgi:hypothetical protein
MNRRWSLSSVARLTDARAPSPWLLLALFVVIQLSGVALRIYSWPKGQSVMVPTFWFGLIVIPVLAWLGICGALFFASQQDQNRTFWWNYLDDKRLTGWRAWAQARAVVVGSVVLSPEHDLAERMLGLEGTTPVNPGKALLLSELAIRQNGSRLESTFEQLLAPLVTALVRMKRARKMEIVYQTESEASIMVLRAVWDRLKLPHTPTFRWLAPNAPSPLAGQWFAERQSDCQLVLACQLHAPDVAPTFSEVAVAVLLTTPHFAASLKIKPQASLFRPITAESDEARDALARLLRAEQTPVDKIQHFWSSHLGKVPAHAAAAAVKSLKLIVEHHEIDRAIGVPGPANRWLAQALASQMVQHGQGAQLVAVPHMNGIAWNVVASQPAPVLQPAHPPIQYLSLPFLGSIAAFVACVFFILLPDGISDMLKIALIAAIPILVALQVAAEMFTLKQVSRSFSDEAR